jgi:hypothetical protein
LEARLAPAIYAGDATYEIVANTSLHVPGGQQLLAQTGFNAQSGINGDPSNPPYQLGTTIHGYGLSEPGWADTWTVSDGGTAGGADLGQAEASPVYEGDGALHIRVSQTYHETWVHREWAEPQFDRFLLEQRLRLPANGIFISRPQGDDYGPVWSVHDGHFYAYDGDGHGGVVGIDTGFVDTPLRWYQVSLLVDVAHQTFQFFVNGQEFQAGHPLHFRGRPTYIHNVDYLADTDAWVDAVRMISVGDSPVQGVLLNDYSPSDEALSATLMHGPAHGSLSFGSNGGFRYVPDAHFVGRDIFTYRISDGIAESNVARVVIRVTGPAPSPRPNGLPPVPSPLAVGGAPAEPLPVANIEAPRNPSPRPAALAWRAVASTATATVFMRAWQTLRADVPEFLSEVDANLFSIL